MSNYTLTAEQRVLAEENHNLIYKYASSNDINVEEFYGVLAIGLCKAASTFDASRGYRFSTLAYRCMDTEYKAYWRHELNTRHIPAGSVMSYNALISNESGIQFLDIVSNDQRKCSIDTGAVEVDEFLKRLSPKQRTVLDGLLSGEKEVTIARRIGCSQSNVSRVKTKLRNEWKLFATKH